MKKGKYQINFQLDMSVYKVYRDCTKNNILNRKKSIAIFKSWDYNSANKMNHSIFRVEQILIQTIIN